MMAKKHQFSPEYLKRREEILADVKSDGLINTVERIMRLEQKLKKSAANESELRKVITKYQNIFGRLLAILGASTNQSSETRSHGGGCADRGLNLPFNYEIAFRNCRVVIADYYEDVRFCNPAGCKNCEEKVKKSFKSKLEKLRS